MATNLQELRARAKLPARQAGGGKTVAEFFEANRSAIAAVLPKHVTPDRLLKVALQAVRNTPQLLDCSSESLMGAVVQLATLGLEPNGVMGHAYLIPYKNRKKNRTDAQVIVGYKGLIDLARRSGQIETIYAHAVRQGDKFDVSLGTEGSVRHKIDFAAGDRGPIVAAYACAKFRDGGYQFEVMSRHEIDQIMAGSQSGGRDGPWKDHYEQMARKTVIRRLANYLPLSVELATAVAMDETPQDYGAVIEGDWTPAAGGHEAIQEDAPAEPTEKKAPAKARQESRAADDEPPPPTDEDLAGMNDGMSLE